MIIHSHCFGINTRNIRTIAVNDENYIKTWNDSNTNNNNYHDNNNNNNGK